MKAYTAKITEELSVELQVKLTIKEINLWRLANAKATSDEEVRKANSLLSQSLRARGARYLVRELGRQSYNAGL
jgi:hypothetical protein